jgi:hypothetical protein
MKREVFIGEHSWNKTVENVLVLSLPLQSWQSQPSGRHQIAGEETWQLFIVLYTCIVRNIFVLSLEWTEVKMEQEWRGDTLVSISFFYLHVHVLGKEWLLTSHGEWCNFNWDLLTKIGSIQYLAIAFPWQFPGDVFLL